MTKASYSDMMENVGEQRNILLVLKNSIDHMDPSINPFQHSSANTSATTEQVILPDLFDYPELKHDQYPIESN
ncbi:MAG: hypothetical protein HYU69_14065 [Bacteroidetes bacterium]|nr:hypothetical protein [Bacteroidota bacterium]